MNITDFGRALRRRWLVVLLAVLLGAGVGALVTVLTPAKYTAQTTLYVSPAQIPGAETSAYEREQVAQGRVKSYLLLVDDPRVLDEVVGRLRLPMTTRQLGTRVVATSPVDSTLIDVAATDTSPALAAQEANTVGEVFVAQSARLDPTAAPGAPPDVTVFVVQPAVPPDLPSSVSPLVTVMLGVLAGLVVGLALALVLHLLDRRVRSLPQLREALPVRPAGSVLEEREPQESLIVLAEPRSMDADAYRRLRSALPQLHADTPGTVLVVGSPDSGDGRTTTLLNLAATSAAAGSRVLVIDADLRRPGLATRLGLQERCGLSEVLTGRISTVDAIWAGGSEVFDVLTSGAPPVSPAEMLGSVGMQELVGTLRDQYDVILIDSSPILPVADMASLAPVADGVLLLCRQGRTTSTQLVEAADLLKTASTVVVGTVLTMAPVSRQARQARDQYLVDVAYPMDEPRSLEGADPSTETIASPVGPPAGRRPSPVPRGV